MSKKNKHMTLDDRIEIQQCLNQGISFKAIAKRIEKDPTTVSKEIKLHLKDHQSGFSKVDGVCPKLLKPPYVCNGCELKPKSSCNYVRRVYSAKHAQKDYEFLLTESRTGIPLNKQEFYRTEAIISKAISKGQHVYHAIHANDLPVSPATVYRHINKGYYSIGRLDLPRAVKFKNRKSNQLDFVPANVKQGRSYQDFLHYMENHKDISFCELDTVLGRIGGKVIMTIHFVSFDFMIGILLDNKTAAEASSKILAFKAHLKDCGFFFGDLFPVLLTDNGGEFSNVSAFENDADGSLQSHLFFCDSYASYEKPHIEKNHTLFRDIVPKGSSFDNFSQDTVNLIFSHVNSVKRKQFNGKSAYELFTFSFSHQLAAAFGIELIPPNNVVQSPALLK